MEVILIIVLFIIIIYLYNQTLIESKQEKYTGNINMQCSRNCGQYNIDTTSTNIAGCLSCGYCGVCTMPNKSQMCMNGNAKGAYFNNDCSGSNWRFGTGVINPTGLNFNYESQLTNLGQTDNLPSKVKNVSYEIPTSTTRLTTRSTNLTSNALADLLNKIYSSNQSNTIDSDTLKQLQIILNKLQSSTS
jgi:hypothetical protein